MGLGFQLQQPLLQEDETGTSSHASEPNDALLHDGNVATEHGPGARRYLFAKRIEELTAGCGDVSAQNDYVRIENVHETDDCRSKVLGRAIEHALGAGVTINRSCQY